MNPSVGNEDRSDERQRLDERQRMVEEQLAAPSDRRAPVLDANVLTAMRKVPRHLFVSEDEQARAYEDAPLSIGGGQTISQPYIVAKMIELLELEPGGPPPLGLPASTGPKVLEIGAGSGYQTAVLALLKCRVFSIEIDADLLATAETRLRSIGIEHVELRCGDGWRGWPEEAPFDAILVSAAPLRVPKPLLDQLAEGGRLVGPVGRTGGVQVLERWTRRGGRVTCERLFEVRFVPMTGTAEHDD